MEYLLAREEADQKIKYYKNVILPEGIIETTSDKVRACKFTDLSSAKEHADQLGIAKFYLPKEYSK